MFIGLVTIAFDELPGFDLLDTSALYHDAMLLIAQDLRLSPDSEFWGIDDVTVGVETVLDSPAKFERLQFSVNVSWFYYNS